MAGANAGESSPRPKFIVAEGPGERHRGGILVLAKVLPTTLAGDPNAPIVHKSSIEERQAAARQMIDEAFREIGDENDVHVGGISGASRD